MYSDFFSNFQTLKLSTLCPAAGRGRGADNEIGAVTDTQDSTPARDRDSAATAEPFR
jgi:hypothetical protein